MLADAIDGTTSTADALAEQVIATMLPDGHRRDDVAVLAVQRGEQPGLAMSAPADPSRLSTLRATVQHWLESVGATPEETSDLVLACGELLANVCVHAHPMSTGEMELRAMFERGTVRVDVIDHGAWRPGRERGGGRGLSIVRATVDELMIETTAAGTHARILRRLTCRVGGEIDLANSGEIFGVIAKAVTADHEEIVLDLAQTTYIDSAGLALLVDINARLRTRRTRLTVLAPDASPAHRLLSLSGLDKVIDVQTATPAAGSSTANDAGPSTGTGTGSSTAPDAQRHLSFVRSEPRHGVRASPTCCFVRLEPGHGFGSHEAPRRVGNWRVRPPGRAPTGCPGG